MIKYDSQCFYLHEVINLTIKTLYLLIILKINLLILTPCALLILAQEVNFSTYALYKVRFAASAKPEYYKLNFALNDAS